MTALHTIIQQLEACQCPLTQAYSVPGMWINGIEHLSASSVAAQQVDPFAFYSQRLSEIAAAQPQQVIQGYGSDTGGNWSRHAIIYNLFPRVTTAFDHNSDGLLTIEANADGWRETGTLLKCIALLPYLRDLGFNTIHLLPISAVGQDGKKGTLGSPYAIRNPYRLDPYLDEPVLGLTAEELFAGFVEASHRLGLRVILEFVLRTGAKDSDWIAEHPDWFYWIRADIPDRIGRGTGRLNAFGSPVFSWDTLNIIRSKVAAGDFHNLPPAPAHYRALYTPPPSPERVKLENGRYIGTLADGTRVRVPGAFTDWPPDDNQPPWTDVTYLRLYDHPDFNYMAYNTIRQYDAALAQPHYQNHPLWEALVGVIPYYQEQFGIDGVMIDMGHALPVALRQRIISTARGINPDFAFWDENFTVHESSRDEGYNAVMGWMVLAAHEPDGMRNVVHHMVHGAFPISFFAAPENHNSMRAMARPNGRSYAHYVLALLVSLPAMPFILSGFELGESQPINTGLGFSNEQLSQYPTDRLPLFSAWAFDWCRPDTMIRSVKYALSLRKKYEHVFNDPAPGSFILGYSDNDRLLVFSRASNGTRISVIANMDQLVEQRGRIVLDARGVRVPGMWGTSEHGMDLFDETMANVSLSPGYVLIIDTTNLPR